MGYIKKYTTLGNTHRDLRLKKITITINQNRVSDRTVLQLAKTILHEAIHARLIEFAKRKGSNAKDFPGVYDFMMRYNDWSHEQMANYYRETIAKGLKHFDNGRHPWEYYMDLAWVGLSGTQAWWNLSHKERDRIEAFLKELKEIQ